MTIDAARFDFGVLFSYRNNPNVTAVFPSNTIPSGGIPLNFTGVYLDVVQQPVLEVYRGAGSPLVSQQPCLYTWCTYSLPLLQRSYCIVVDNTTITCSTPSLGTTSLTPLDYALLVDDAPPNTQAYLPISVQSDPSNFRLEGSQEITSGTVTLIHIVVHHIAYIYNDPISIVCVSRVIISTQLRPVRYEWQ